MVERNIEAAVDTAIGTLVERGIPVQEPARRLAVEYGSDLLTAVEKGIIRPHPYQGITKRMVTRRVPRL